MSTLFGLLIAVTIIGLISSIVILIVSKLHLGLEVDGFGNAFIAAFIIAIVAGLITWMLSILGVQDSQGFIGGIVHLVISVGALLISARILSGLRIAGLIGAIVASVAIGAVYWLGGLLLGLIVA
jgi:putative membrane protein